MISFQIDLFMKKLLLFFALVLYSSLAFSQALSGTYVIGSTQPSPFNTLTNAVARINTSGVSGPVVFLLNDATYTNATGENFPIKINKFAGTSITNTLTIKPNLGKTVTITGTNVNSYTGLPSILQLDGADNVIINGSNTAGGNSRDLTITNDDNVAYVAKTAVWISSNTINGANNISILNTKLQMNNRNQDGKQLSGIFSGSNGRDGSNGLSETNSTAANSNITITNNLFTNVRQGMVVRGGETTNLKTANILFSQNQLGSTAATQKPSIPLDFLNVDSAKILYNTIQGVDNTTSTSDYLGIIITNSTNSVIKGNIIRDLKTTASYSGRAIWIKGITTKLEISENKISNIKNTTSGQIFGIHLDVSASSSEMSLINNFISDISTPLVGEYTESLVGINIANGTGTKLYHNTVALNDPNNGLSSALKITGGSGYDIRNNIFSNTSGTGGQRYAIFSTVSAFTAINYNNYYAAIIGKIGGANYATLSEWKAVTGKDQNSLNVLPIFNSISDLHLIRTAANSGLDNKGENLSTVVPNDIDDEVRNIGTAPNGPDMGADEFSIAVPLAGEPTIQATKLNFTNVTANSFNVNWTNGNGANRIVVIRSGSAVNSAPVDATAYNANTIFGSGSQIGSGNYVVYNGTGNTVSITGLSPTTTYYVSVYEYNGSGSNANYLTGGTPGPLSGSQLTLNAALGWQIANTNTLNTITFDTTVDGVNVGQFIGNGFAPAPISGQLNSNSWALDGFEDGAIAFGGINTNPDFGRGTSNGGVTEGGIYAFNTSANNAALGIQPTANDFTPGTVTLRFQNQTSAPITSISLGYKVYIYNNAAASNSFNFSHSADNTIFTSISELDVISPITADINPSWKASYRVATISGLNIPANGFYYLKWTGTELIAGTAYDEFALDDIVLSANATTVFPEFGGIAENFSVHGNTGLSSNTSVNGDLKFTAGKLSVNANTLTLGGTVINTVTGGIKGSANSNITVINNGNKTLSFDQTTPGVTNLLNNFSIPFSAAVSKTVLLDSPIVVNGVLNVGLDQTLDFKTNTLSGNLATITVDGAVLTQNTTTTPFPASKIWGGTGILHLNAISSVQNLVAGTYNNLRLSSTGGTVTTGTVNLNGVLDLPTANTSATNGSLSMGTFTLAMGPDATNTGVGDVTGIIQRNHQFVAGKTYTFGHPNSSILFTTQGTLPTSMSAKLTMGVAPSWRNGAINRHYDIIQGGASGTKAFIRQHYLDSELNNNTESRLVFWANKAILPAPTFEQGRSSINTDDNWVEITNADIGLYFEQTFGKVFITLDETEAAVLTWNGEKSNSWTTVGNWTANDGTKTAIPSLATQVIIPNVSPLPQPILNPTTQVLSIEIQSGAVVNSTPNDVLEIYGTSGAWTNNGGIFNAPSGTGKVIFKKLDATISGNTKFNNIEIGTGASLRTLDGNAMTIGGTFTNNGILFAGLNPNTITYSGIGQTVIYPNGTPLEAYYNLIISGASAVFPTNLNLRGDFTLNAAVDFANKSINMIGDVDQNLAGTAAVNLNNLTVNKESGSVLIEKDVAVNGILTLTKGKVVLGSNNLTLGTSAVAGGPFNVNTMIVADGTGFVRRPFTAPGAYFFPIGDTTSSPAYSPISINLTAGSFSTGYVSVSVTDDIHPNNNSLQNYISRYWNVKQTGISAAVATITATYVQGELIVPAETMIAGQLTGTFNVETNPWKRFSPLSGLTLNATGATLTNEVSVFTGIKGGDFATEIKGGEAACQNDVITLTSSVMGGDMLYTYLWSSASEPNLGTESSLSPAEFVGTNDYTLTVTDANGRKTTATKSVTTIATATAGSLSGDQTVCFSYSPNDITLTGNSANVLYWQRSDEPSFLNPVTIANTTTTLTGIQAGQITGLTYFRAAINNGSCSAVFTPAITISTKTTVWNGTGWSNGDPDRTTAAVIDGSYSVAANITACSLTVTNGAVVTIPAGYDVIIDGALIVDNATFNLKSNTNLVQKRDAINYGSVTVERESSSLFRLDYTMWGSPVTGTQTLKQFSPKTVSNRFYIYNSLTDLFNVITPETNTFSPGKGYLIRMPDNHSAITASPYLGVFTGIPNNGTITQPLSAEGNGFNMIANPYASLIDSNEFLNANAAEIEGTLYFWRRRNNIPDASAYYATYTLAGGTASASSEKPNGHIQVGQGFIVKKATTAPVTGNTLFTNAMRTANHDNQFFRTSNTEERSRIWLNVTNTAGVFGQTLVAYMPQAENGLDRTDGKYLNDGSTALTSWLNNSEYIIQGRAPFSSSDVVALNFKTLAAGSYTIAIDHVDGLFSGDQKIYLRDKYSGVTQNLKTGAYTFNTTVGTFNSRFELVYENGTLVVDNPAFNSQSVVLYKKEGNLIVKSKGIILQKVEIFDFAGRLLAAAKDINSKETSIVMNSVNQVLVVKITSTNGQIITKKIIN